ncbi:alpha/beta fold hydrolase [Streptomyces massasporeus]
MGGETALDFTLAHPERVTALALVGASVSGHVWPSSLELSAYATARREHETATLAELELAIWAAMGRTAPGGELIEIMVAANAERRVVSNSTAFSPRAVMPSRTSEKSPRRRWSSTVTTTIRRSR